MPAATVCLDSRPGRQSKHTVAAGIWWTSNVEMPD
jgi:hypothetical protein